MTKPDAPEDQPKRQLINGKSDLREAAALKLYDLLNNKKADYTPLKQIKEVVDLILTAAKEERHGRCFD